MNTPVFIVAIEHDLERYGIEHIIASKLTQSLIIHAQDLHDAHRSLFDHERAVVVVSIDQFDIDNLPQIVALSTCFNVSNWLIIAENTDDLFLLDIISAFPNASVVLKTNKIDALSSAVYDTYNGHKYYCEEVETLMEENKNRKKEGVLKRNLLTSTELELVQLITQGKTAKEIAELRCLSFHTVNTHRKNIFRKLEINNVQELIKYALRNGLVDLTEYYI